MTRAGGSYRLDFIAFSAEDWRRIANELRRHADAAADLQQAAMPELEAAWNRTDFPAQGFPWEEQRWMVLAVLVGNTGLTRNSYPEPPPPVHPGGKKYWTGGYEPFPGWEEIWLGGFNSNMPGNGLLHYGYFWLSSVEHRYVELSDVYTRMFTAMTRGTAEAEAIIQQAGLLPEQGREKLATLIESGILRCQDDRLALAFPVFTPAEDTILAPVVDRIAGSLAHEILEPATAGISDELDQMGYRALRDQYVVWRTWMHNIIAQAGLRCLLQRGVLPPLPEPLPATFGLLGWFEGVRVMTWR